MTVTVHTAVTETQGRDGAYEENRSTTETYWLEFGNQTLRKVVTGEEEYEGYYNASIDDMIYQSHDDEDHKFGIEAPRRNVSAYANPRIGEDDTAFSFIEVMNFTYAGLQTGYVRYTATNITVPAKSNLRLREIPSEDYTNITASLVVDEQGRLREFTLKADIYRHNRTLDQPQYVATHTIRITASGYGTTVAQKSEWVETVRTKHED
ncbi:hypothetical protein [Halorussus sp. MSC15.2]|uniref:hypothetical protein n=1 Tax=Halorussus sp. MSC15.2 TaxID=2283638 RepID=UPI0013D52BB9|nr:hypothetical protein [Halorussus sp. MSC15.2]NEU56415.1 hypothetical protein [Halorussus sp. MSC15.2]